MLFRANTGVYFDGNLNPGLGKYNFNGLNKTINGTSVVTFDDIKCAGSYTNNINITVLTTLTGGGTWSQGPTGILNLQILDANFTTNTFNAATIGNTVNYSRAGAQNIRVPSDGSYSNLSASGSGIKSLLANTIANGNIVISSTLSATASNFNMTVGGNWTNNGGLFTPGTAIVTFSSALTQSISKTGGEIFHHLAFSGAGVKTFLSPITANGNFSIAAGATVDVSSANNQLTIKGNYLNNGTFNARAGLVHFNGSTGQTIGGTSVTNFNDITLGNPGGASLSSAQNLLGALTLTTGVFNTNSQLFTMVSTATACARIAPIISPGDISGNVKVQRFAPGGYTGWALMGTPISSPLTFADWNDNFGITCPTCPNGFGGFYSIYSYDETKPGKLDTAIAYVPVNNITDPIVQNKGYWVYFGNGNSSTTDIIIDVTGTVRKFNNTIPLNYTNFGSPINDGWNLIHNPYPSPISWTALKGATPNIDNAIYVYNADLNAGAGGFASYVNGVSSPAVGSGGVGNTIPMSQAFYVHSTGATALTAQESNKVAGNPAYLKTNSTQPNSLLRISLTNANSFNDETVLYFQQGATNVFDNGYDSYKMRGQDPNAPIIALVNGADDFQINGIAPISGNFTMPLKTLTGYAGTYTISAGNIASFPLGACISLYDKFTQITTNLKTSDYIFTLSDTTTVARFDLNITINPLNINSNVSQPTCQIANTGQIIVSGSNSGPWNYIWKLNGNVVKTSLNKNGSDSLTGLSAGNYNAEVNTVGMCDYNTSSFLINTQISPTALFVCADSLDLGLTSSISFFNSSINSSSYFWDFGDNTGTSTVVSPLYNYYTPGFYNVKLITTSNTGCVDSINKIIKVTGNTVGIPTITSNASGILVRTMGNNEFILQQQFTEPKTLYFKLFDASGRLTKDYGEVTSDLIQFPVNLNFVSPGLYFLKISSAKEMKVIKLLAR
ncbi:MAG: hypothetical protein H0W61_10820 [Bacteroidetes bacterium]|nr:hypothetical protein [Bacteroidota bacterium]